jgi:hypothetical protein
MEMTVRKLMRKKTMPAPWAAIVVPILCAVALLPSAHAQVSPKQLTKDDVITLLKGDVSPKRVAELVQQRGIDFVVTPETEQQLRRLGATDSLLTKLKESAPKPTALAPVPVAPTPVPTSQPALTVTPPRALLEIHTNPPFNRDILVWLYIDDQPQRTIQNSDGQMQILGVLTGQHRLRLEVPNYQRYEETVDLVPGLNTRSVTLVPVTFSAPNAPIQLPGVRATSKAAKVRAAAGQTRAGDIITFDGVGYWYGIVSIADGGLTVSKEGLVFNDYEPTGAHNLRLSCSEIVEAKAVPELSFGQHGAVLVKGRSKHYDFAPEYDLKAAEANKASKEVAKQRKAAIIEAISNACNLH